MFALEDNKKIPFNSTPKFALNSRIISTTIPINLSRQQIHKIPTTLTPFFQCLSHKIHIEILNTRSSPINYFKTMINRIKFSLKLNMGGTITNRSISHLYLLEMHENQDNISLANLTNISVTDRMDGVYLYEDDMEEMQEERHETTGGIILTEWGWNDRCDPGETGHENCERVVLGDLLPRRPVRIREKIRLQPMDNIVNTQQPFAATTLLLLAIFQAVCRSDLRNLVLVFLRDANLERRNVLMLWRHFANEHFRWSRRNPPLMKDEDWTHVVSVRRKCKVAEAALGQHLVRPAHLPEFRNFDWQHIDFTASAEVRLTTEEFCNRHHRFLQTAINIQRHELFYGRQPTLRATANIMIMGDSFNEQLKRKGLFVDGMVANFGSHDWGVIQIGTEVQQIITTTGRGYIMLNNNLTDEEFREKCINDTAHLLTNFEYRSRGVLVTLPPYIHSHPTKWEILKNVFVVSARRFNFGMLEPRFSQNNAYPLFVNEVGEPTARGILDYIGTLRAAIPGFPLKEEEIGPIAAHDDRPPTPIRLPTPPPAPPVDRPTKKKSRLDVPPEVEKENRNLGGASGSGSVGTSTSQVPNKERTMAGSAGPSTSNDTGRDRTMAGRWGPSTPPDMGRDRTSEENRGPQAFQNVNRDGTWDTNCMEQSTSQPVDRDQTAPQNWNENMAGSSTNAFGECWRDSVTQRGSQVDKLSRQIEDYYEFHQQIDEETERKQRVFKIIKDAIKERKVWYPELTTASVTGSSSTQLAAFESDFDLTFATTKPLSIEKKLEILRGLQHVFGRREFDFYNIDIIPSNRVPVLEMKYMEKGRRRPTLNIDITIGNDNASTHTTLINNWTANDPRFIPLAFFSKAWFKHIGAGNSRNEGFNSISIIFLLGYYLMKEEVLPKEANANFVSKNNNSLGQLFIGFLQFLHQFDFQNTAISILHGVSFPKKLTGNNNRYEVVILDPSSVGPIEYASNTARCVRSGGLTKLSMALGKLQRLQEEEINFDSLFQ
uniref:PAP-associated domain-containing protein n=1 Tax=Meloidogyne incognita TaxID=6306 RepID=A0A914LBD9_MELIC